VTVVIWGFGVERGKLNAFCDTLVVLCLLVDGLLLSSACRESYFGFEAVTEVG